MPMYLSPCSSGHWGSAGKVPSAIVEQGWNGLVAGLTTSALVQVNWHTAVGPFTWARRAKALVAALSGSPARVHKLRW